MLEQIKLSEMLEVAVVAARLAGSVALEQMNYAKARIKSSDQLVTETDVRCQKIIIDRIKQTYPDDGFIAEEGQSGELYKQPPRADSEIWWVIDPIDGTNNFAHRLPLFAISIAAMYQGRPVVGAIFDPSVDAMFTAVESGSARLNNRTISCNEEVIDYFTGIGVDGHYERGTNAPAWLSGLIPRMKVRNLGATALHLAYVANGSFAAAVVNTPKLWDIAAGGLIAEAAGAKLSDWQGNDVFPLDLNEYQGQSIQTLAANQRIYNELVEFINAG